MNQETKITDELQEAVKRLRDWAANDDDVFDRAKKMSDSLEKVLTRAIITISNQSTALLKLGESLSYFCETLATMVAININSLSTSAEDRAKVSEIEAKLSEFVKGFN